MLTFTSFGSVRKGPVLVALITFAWACSAHAATLRWDADIGTSEPQDGNGTWDTVSQNWWQQDTAFTGNVAYSSTTPDSATFGSLDFGNSYTVTVAAGVTVDTLAFTPGPTYTLEGAAVTLSNSPLLVADASCVLNVDLAGEGFANITKIGGATMTINGDITYTGTTTIGAGTLVMNGAASNSAFILTSGDSLRGHGFMKALTVQGTVNPGALSGSPGELAMGGLTLSGGGAYRWEFTDALSTPGLGWDVLTVTGEVTVASVATNPFIVRVDAVPTGFDDTITQSWSIVSGSAMTGFDAAAFSIERVNFPANGDVALSEDAGDLVLTYTPLPRMSIIGGITDELVENGSTIPSSANGTDFGSGLPGAQITGSLRVYNDGAVPLTISNISTTGVHAVEFEILSYPAVVSPGQESNIVIRFTPGDTGIRTATLAIDNNDPDNTPYTFAVKGFGSDLSAFSHKMMIRFCGYGRDETLTNIPLMVTLNESIPGFAYADFASTNGIDLRFLNSDETAFLDFEFDTWDTSGDSTLWVKVPELAGTNTSVWAYWGNPSLAAIADPADIGNLQIWLKADAGVVTNTSGEVVTWADQSVNARVITNVTGGTTRPLLAEGVINGRPAVQFDGIDDLLESTYSINGLQGMTIVTVTRATNNYDITAAPESRAAIHWTETSPWGQTYVSPQQTNLAWRFGTGQAANSPIYTRPVEDGFTISVVVHDGVNERVSVAGETAVTQSGKFAALAGNASRFTVGFSDWNDTTFDGEIAELLVFTRALTAGELNELGYYLTDKYGIATTYSDIPSFALDGSTWDDGFAGVWHFNDGAGSSAGDSSPSGGTGTLIDMDAGTDWVDGVIAGALDFDGINDYVNTPVGVDQGNPLQGVTLSAWVYPRSIPDVRDALIWTDNGGWDWSITLDSRDGQSWYVLWGDFEATSGHLAETGVWQQVVAVFDPIASNVTVYKNAEPMVVSSLDQDASSGTIRIGGQVFGNNLDGIIDEVRAEDVARGSNWVYATYLNVVSNSGFGCFGTVIETGGGEPDEDADGLPDNWESRWCSGNATCVVASIDQDGDGLTGAEEYVLDFNPISETNAAFAIDATQLNAFTVTFGPTTNSRLYALDYTLDLTEGGGWMEVESDTGSNGVTSVVDPAGDNERNYRIRVTVP